MSSSKQHLLALTLDELVQVALNLGLPRFVGRQMCEWIYGKKVTSIDEMTNISKTARENLKSKYDIGTSKPVDCMRSID